MGTTPHHTVVAASKVIKAKNTKPAFDHLFTKYSKPGSIKTMLSRVKSQCLIHCRDHVQVLEKAKRGASPEVQGYLTELQQETMQKVASLQHEAIVKAERGIECVDAVLIGLTIVPAYLADLKIPAEMYKEIAAAAEEKKRKRVVRIANMPKVYQMFVDILKDKEANPRCRTLALLLCTGRRTAEILGTGVFEEVPGFTHVCEFSGQTKNHCREKAYLIPTIVPAKDIQEAVKEVREALGLCKLGIGFEDAERRMDINGRFAQSLREWLRKLMKPYTRQETLIRPHDLRGVFIELAYQGCPHLEAPAPYFAKHVVGHESTHAVAAYNRFRIEGLASLELQLDFLDEHMVPT